MQIDITGHHLELTDAIRQHINARLSRLGQHLDNPPDHVHVVLEVEKNAHRCDIKTHCGGEDFFAHGEDAVMYAAIDRAADKMERQLRDAKNKKLSRRSH